MEFTLFIGCNIPARVPQYELAARAVLSKLDVRVKTLEQFNCCGYPMRNADFETYLLFAARNLALAEATGRNLMTLCKCCFGSLKKADQLLKEDKALRNNANEFLDKEGLAYSGELEVTHLLSVLHKDVGLKTLKKSVSRKFEKLNIATHYGCHALRPSAVMQFDDPANPTIFDDLVKTTGAASIDWATKLECCGAPATGINDELAMDLTAKKINDGKQAGADYICAACPWCQLQFDTVQKAMADERGTDSMLGSILYPQLLGLAMGIPAKELGIDMNVVPINAVETFQA